jgi:hypothetical protein
MTSLIELNPQTQPAHIILYPFSFALLCMRPTILLNSHQLHFLPSAFPRRPSPKQCTEYPRRSLWGTHTKLPLMASALALLQCCHFISFEPSEIRCKVKRNQSWPRDVQSPVCKNEPETPDEDGKPKCQECLEGEFCV